MRIHAQVQLTAPEVLIAYDTIRAGKYAKELCDRLGQRLAPECEVKAVFWSLHMLQVPSLAWLATRDATRADLLIVAVNGDEALPPGIKRWIDRWARQTHRADRAVAVQLHGIRRTTQGLSPAYGCLKQVAEDAGMEFFAEVIEPADDEHAYWMETIQERTEMQTAVLEAILHHH